MIKVCIIDDEESNRIILSHFLSQYTEIVDLIGQAANVRSGVQLINELKPDLILLDIEMPDGSGFDLLNQLEEYIPEIIFCTAYNQFALKAIEFSALDYILKPVTKDALATAIKKATVKVDNKERLEQYEILKDRINNPLTQPFKFAVSNSDGTHIININELLYCSAHSNYTDIHLVNEKKITISKTLKEIEIMLVNQPLIIRIHQSNIVNIDKIIHISRTENSLSLLMSNHVELSVSRNKKEELLQRIRHIAF